MSVLKCQYTEWNNKPVVELPTNTLFQSVPIAEQFAGNVFYENIKKDINENGLHFPLLVVDAQFWQLLEQWNMHQKHMMPLPSGFRNQDRIYVVWGGSNRLAIARELGYEKVDCVVYENGDFASAHRDQGLHRKPFQQFYTPKNKK